MMLHEEGAFQLEHPVAKYLPAFMADQDPELERVPGVDVRTRPLWMIWHRDFEEATYFKTVKDRITDTLRQRLS